MTKTEKEIKKIKKAVKKLQKIWKKTEICNITDGQLLNIGISENFLDVFAFVAGQKEYSINIKERI